MLQNFSTEEDVEKLAGSFKKQEEENFALFNYVNELSHEVETLNETVHQLRDNIGEWKCDALEVSLIVSSMNILMPKMT